MTVKCVHIRHLKYQKSWLRPHVNISTLRHKTVMAHSTSDDTVYYQMVAFTHANNRSE